MARAPANVRGVCCVVLVEAKKLSTLWFDSPPLVPVVLDDEVVVPDVLLGAVLKATEPLGEARAVLAATSGCV